MAHRFTILNCRFSCQHAGLPSKRTCRSRGHINTVVAACVSCTQAIGEALDVIRHGLADMDKSGGIDSS